MAVAILRIDPAPLGLAGLDVEARDFPVNKGRMCPKGVTAYQQINHPQRLTYPMMRKGGKGSPLERCTWDEALDAIVRGFKDVQAKHGGNAVSIYSGSSLTTEKTYLMGKFARVAVGTGNVDYNGRLCMVSAAYGNNKAFGIDRAANPWSDIARLSRRCVLPILDSSSRVRQA